MGSSRLPGKVMMNLDGNNSVLYYVIKQVENSKLIEKIIIATTELKEDDIIVNLAKTMGVSYFRGDTNDVLDRYYQCARKFSFSIVVRITSDNPLVDPSIIDVVVKKFLDGGYDYVTNSQHPRTHPQGTEIEVFSFKALELGWENSKKSSEREHVTSYFYNNPDKFRIFNVRYKEDISNLRWSIDRIEDLKLVKKIVSMIKQRPILLDNILELFLHHPELIEINKNHVADEGYLKSLREDKTN